MAHHIWAKSSCYPPAPARIGLDEEVVFLPWFLNGPDLCHGIGCTEFKYGLDLVCYLEFLVLAFNLQMMQNCSVLYRQE